MINITCYNITCSDMASYDFPHCNKPPVVTKMLISDQKVISVNDKAKTCFMLFYEPFLHSGVQPILSCANTFFAEIDCDFIK